MRAYKAVSEVLGYILILAIVVATITVIYAAGMPAVRSQQDIAVFRSMENTFYILQNVERLVAYNITPEKAVTVRAEGGSIAVIPDFGWINISVTYQNKTQISDELPINCSCGALVYIHRSGKAIILFSSAIINYYDKNTVKIISGPRFNKIVDPSRGLNIYLSIINVDGIVSFAGSKTLIFKNNKSKIYPPIFHNLDHPNSARNVTIYINIKNNILGLNSTAIKKELLNFINMHLFNGYGNVSYEEGKIWVKVKKHGNPPETLNYNYLNLTIGYYNITVSG